MMSSPRSRSLGLKPTTSSGSVGATFQLAAKFGAGRPGGIAKRILISLTSEDRRARPHMNRVIDCAVVEAIPLTVVGTHMRYETAGSYERRSTFR
jgi:hypothetical protein